MKTIVLTIIIALVTLTSFAGPAKKNSNFSAIARESKLPVVNKIDLIHTSHFLKATFFFKNVKNYAYYSHTGDLAGTGTVVPFDELPIEIKRELGKNFCELLFKEAILFMGMEETAYFISAENENNTFILKASDGKIEVFESRCKNAYALAGL